MKKIVGLLLFSAFMVFTAPKTYAQIGVGVGLSIRIAPPELPVYVQPICPGEGYIWTPGYWAYGDDGYYWVPGVWVVAPQIGYLWTPSYWGFEGGFYGFHAGYWGPHIGFYGGVNYGFGYGGHGYYGGMWQGGRFRYNSAVSNVNINIVHNTYIDRTVIVNNNVNRTSFNGPGGVNERPRAEEQRAMTEHHIQPTTAQVSHQRVARMDKTQYANVNHGHPAVAAMNKVNGARYSPEGHAAPHVNPVPHNAAVHNTAVHNTVTPQQVHRENPVVQHNAVAPQQHEVARPPVANHPAPVVRNNPPVRPQPAQQHNYAPRRVAPAPQRQSVARSRPAPAPRRRGR